MALSRRILETFFNDDVVVPRFIDEDTIFSPRWDRWMLMPFATPINLDIAFDLPRLIPKGYEFHEDDKNYYVELNAPNFKASEMAVKLEETSNGPVLQIMGEHKGVIERGESPRSIKSKFSQRILLGTNVDCSGISASTTKKGVLEVKLPKREPDVPHHTRIIPITDG